MNLLRSSLTSLVLLALFFIVGCASTARDKNEMHHAYWSTKGFIAVDFWKQPDGSYLFTATADAHREYKDILDAWHKFVAFIGRGRTAEGEPSLGEFDYKQGYTPMNPYSMGQPRTAKRASGIVRFSGEMTEK